MLVVLGLACGPSSPPEPRPLAPGTFAFGVFGDGPYRAWEMGRFRTVIEDVNAAELDWLIHIGDILWYPCSDEAYAGRLEAMNAIRHPVVYTPGDNEWTDCHEPIAGSYDPLERLARLRAMFFANPGASLGGRTLRLEWQGKDSIFAEFVENVRWTRGGFLFATLHLVGSDNASEAFPGRTSAHDEEVARRADAAIAWLEEAFSIATAEGLTGIVLAQHGDPGFAGGAEERPRPGFVRFLDRLETLVREFPGPVLLIHGDSHNQRVDRPLHSRLTGERLANFTRLETFGSPDIGWIRVVVDTVAGRVVEYEPRLTSRWRFW